jgi:hypothetical protein
MVCKRTDISDSTRMVFSCASAFLAKNTQRMVKMGKSGAVSNLLVKIGKIEHS